MADKVRYRKLLQFIPGLTKYRFKEAKRHCLTYGRGAPVPSVRVARTDVTTVQIEHFISFITSSHLVQDLPFGERSITLSNKETIKISNVVRMMIPERVVKQYLHYRAWIMRAQQARRHLKIWSTSSTNLETRGKVWAGLGIFRVACEPGNVTLKVTTRLVI